MAVDAEHHALDPADGLPQVPDDGGVVARHGVADRVRDVQRRGPGLHRLLDDFGQEVQFRPGGVFRRELHVLDQIAGAADALDGPADDLLRRHLELELAVDGTRGQEDVDARPGGVLHGEAGPVDVGRVAPGQAADDRPVDLPRDRLDRLEVAGRGDGEAGLDHVHAQVAQRPSHVQLLGQVHAAAGRLLAVAQRGVEDGDAVRVGRHNHARHSSRNGDGPGTSVGESQGRRGSSGRVCGGLGLLRGGKQSQAEGRQQVAHGTRPRGDDSSSV